MDEMRELPHILIIEDDKDVTSMLSTILTLDGFRVSTANNGEEGLEKAELSKPDLVVLDVMMPGKGGLEVMREIRANPKTSRIPILFLSAVGDESVVVQGLKGADDYVLKPFKPLELELRINKILDRAAREGQVSATVRRLPDRIAIQVGEETHLVPLKEIYFVEAAGKYSYIHTRNRRVHTGYSMGDLEKRLAPTGLFLRVHRSFMINLEHMRKLARDSRKRPVVVMGDEKKSEITVSDSFLPAVKERLGL